MAYRNIHKWSEIDADTPIVWNLKWVVCCHHYIRLEHPSYLGLTFCMAIGWKHGENTPEALSITGADDSVTYTIHARNHNLLESQGCKPLGNIVKDKKKLLCPSNQVKLRLLHTTSPKCMLNGTSIDFLSKEQPTVETATYDSEPVATQTCAKQIMDLQQTLRYLGVSIRGQSYMSGDNESVMNSSSLPEAKLHNQDVALSFHRVREAVAANMLSIIHIDSALNPADILSKHWGDQQIWTLLLTLMFWSGDTAERED
ncbi:unnamed protein product [Cylindrotheca closterium]|uniref:Uncharacterized protein n=1 Tax=Cylindrotheca closterium TaxID=2856 RepID=A0AAD2CVH5_9STRA|nr:unnamed protein product [Cylindrotheca closterium]CAJ1944777.1 unnamed protein product [Cylindrotheca closterium]CAJ1944793.1 unnamed protein product [Cylindrotheca closterium]CAJ1944801.1 unnamed protein product [Cylindrotheca closterium]